MTFPLKFEQEFLARTMKELEAMEEQVACSRLYPFPNLSFLRFFQSIAGSLRHQEQQLLQTKQSLEALQAET